MKATDRLLTDHKMIRKLLESFSPDRPAFRRDLKLLSRAVVGHAWFEDEIFLPAFSKRHLLKKIFNDEINQEHKDIRYFLDLLARTADDEKKEIDADALQLRAILDNHFKKEEDALFPLAERILDEDGLNRLGDEMEKRKTDIRDEVKNYY